MGLIWLTAVRQATATMRLMHVSTGMKSATMSGLKYLSYSKSRIRIFVWGTLLDLTWPTWFASPPCHWPPRYLLGHSGSRSNLKKQMNCLYFKVFFIFHMLNCWLFIFAWYCIWTDQKEVLLYRYCYCYCHEDTWHWFFPGSHYHAWSR